jgi:hypothetical protein
MSDGQTETTDHGPQRQPASDVLTDAEADRAVMQAFADHNAEMRADLVRLRAENERYRAALEQYADLDNWQLNADHRYEWPYGEPTTIAADALRGEER